MTKNATEQQTKDIKRHFTKIKMTQTWEDVPGYYIKKNSNSQEIYIEV